MISWSDKYQVGVEKFDVQHRNFFKILDRLVQEKEKGAEAVRGSVDSLIHYVTEHFHEEETLMQIHHYPGYEAHVKEHCKLMEKTQRLYADMDAGNPVSVERVQGILVSWILEHIAEIDQSYAPFFMAKGVR